MQNPRVTAGLRWAPLRRPIGEMATSAARIPKVRPMVANRRSGVEMRVGDARSETSATTEKPRKSCVAVPANSHEHSTMPAPRLGAAGGTVAAIRHGRAAQRPRYRRRALPLCRREMLDDLVDI